MKLERSCPISDTHTVREIYRDDRFITLKCSTCKREIIESVKELVEIPQDMIMVTYDGLPEFQAELDDDVDSLENMCNEYMKLTNNS